MFGEYDCGRLTVLEPRIGMGYNDYGLNGETLADQYRSYARGDLLALVTHAADMVACLSQNWTVGLPGPLGLGDMSEGDGAIRDKGWASRASARHPR